LIFLFVFLIVETSIYSYFICNVYNAKGLLFIGNQPILDTLYKVRLIYSLYYAKGKKDYIFSIDDDLGYALGRNKKSLLYSTNSAGMRGEKEYSLIPSKDVLRIACFGDSYVFCEAEKDEDIWTYQLENSVGKLEILNFGVSGYGVIQQYLHYLKDGLIFSPHIIFNNRLGLVPIRDAVDYLTLIDSDMRQAEFYRVMVKIEKGILKHQVLSVFDLFDPQWRNKNIYDKLDFYKNNKWLSSKLLSFCNLTLLLKVCYIKHKISKMLPLPEPDLSELNLALLENFTQIAKRHNSILIFVDYHSIEGFPKEIKEFFERNKQHVKYFGIRESFDDYLASYRLTRKDLMNHTAHYNAIGNEIYAKVILDILINNEWDVQDKIFHYDKDSNSFLYRQENNENSSKTKK